VIQTLVIMKGIMTLMTCDIMAPFTSLKKQAETLFWLIYWERKILFRLKKKNKLKSTNYKTSEHGQYHDGFNLSAIPHYYFSARFNQGMTCTFVLNISQPLLSSFYKHGMSIISELTVSSVRINFEREVCQ